MKKFGNPCLYRSFVSGIVKKRALNQNKYTNTIAYKNAGNHPYSRNFGPPKSGVLGLSLFSLMVNPPNGKPKRTHLPLGQGSTTFSQIRADLSFQIIQCANYICLFVQVKVNNTCCES